MKHFALAGPFILWLVLAVPLNCHNGATSPWAASGHLHEGGALGFEFARVPGGPEPGNSQPVLCQHQSSEAAASIAYGIPDSSLESSAIHMSPGQARHKPGPSSNAGPREVSLPPPDKPPSQPA